MNIWTILTLIFSFMMAFSIGANDAANGLGTSYGTKAIPMWAIISNGAMAEFVGAMFCSDKVSAVLTQDVIKNINTLTTDTRERMMFAVCLASFCFIMFSSASGMPISGTHTVVGAMLGAGVVASSVEALNWVQLGIILASWVASPILSCLISFTLMFMVSSLTMDTVKWTYSQRIYFMQLITGFCMMALIFILDKLFNRRIEVTASHTSESAESEHKFFGLPHWAYYVILEAVGFFGGQMICRFILILHLTHRQHGKQSCGFICAVLFRALICIWDTEVIEMMTLNIRLSDDNWDGQLSLTSEQSVRPAKLKKSLKQYKKQDHKFQIDFSYRIDYKQETSKFREYKQSVERLSLISEQYRANPSFVDRGSSMKKENEEGAPLVQEGRPSVIVPTTQEEVEAYYYRQAMLQSQVYRVLMVFSDFLVCLSHGSNDCSNAISPLIVLMNVERYPIWVSYLVGAGGIACGLFIFGERVMKTIGGDIIALDYMKGFCSQFATALCVALGSSLGITLSTTHCIVGALAGVHFAGKTRFMKLAYNKKAHDELLAYEEEQEKAKENEDIEFEEDEGKKKKDGQGKGFKNKNDEASKMNLKTMKKILFYWAITLPFAFAFGAFLTWVLKFIK